MGSFIADSDVTGNQAVVVLGANIANTLFAGADPTGQAIRIRGQSFKVLGVMEAKGGNGFGSLDNQIYLPITTELAKLTGGRAGAPVGAGKVIDTIYIKSTTPNTVDKAISEANDVLAAQHRTKSGQPDWQVTNQADQLQAAKDTQKTYQIFLLVIASISLLVGGIGIMNIMLVERHRAHARDRHPQGDRGEEAGHHDAVHHRVGGDEPDRRADRGGLRACWRHTWWGGSTSRR